MKARASALFAGVLSLGAGSVGLALVLLVILVALIGPFVAPYSPTAFVSLSFAHPSQHFPLGTDVLGRDTLSRVLAWRLAYPVDGDCGDLDRCRLGRTLWHQCGIYAKALPMR